MPAPVLRILVLSFYYPPDLGPGALRAAAFVRALRRIAPVSTIVEVITTSPHRYKERDPGPWEAQLAQDGILIHRQHAGPGRLLGFARFACRVFRSTANQHYDVVFATSARLGTAAVAARIAEAKACPLLLDLRDDVVGDVRTLFGGIGKLIAPALVAVERFAFSRAASVSLVSLGHVRHFRQAWPSTDFLFVPHGVPAAFGSPTPWKLAKRDARTLVMYAGTIGEAQAIHRIIPGLALHLRASHDFVIIGGGSRRNELARRVAHLPNVTLRPPVAQLELAHLYADADILFASLEPGSAFDLVVPSKLFEMIASGKPIVAGVSGEAARFLKRNAPDARLFPPGDLDGAIDAFKFRANSHRTDRSQFLGMYGQDAVVAPLARRALAFAQCGDQA
ncbi:MAG: glycosyltransferase family 4 protein [Pseudomonadota bacterium]